MSGRYISRILPSEKKKDEEPTNQRVLKDVLQLVNQQEGIIAIDRGDQQLLPHPLVLLLQLLLLPRLLLHPLLLERDHDTLHFPCSGIDICSVSAGLHFLASGGLCKHSVSQDCTKNLTCSATLNSNTHGGGATHLALCGNNRLINFDIRRSTALAAVEYEANVTCISTDGRNVVCGSDTGELCLRDSRTLQVQARIQAHTGAISALDCKDGLVATCGVSTRHGQYVTDNMVNIYDVRRAMAPISKVPFVAGPQVPLSTSACQLHTHTLTHPHTLTITCTGCYDEIKGTQDLKIYSHAHSLIPSLPAAVTSSKVSLLAMKYANTMVQLVKFHPTYTGTLVVAAASGQFSMMEVHPYVTAAFPPAALLSAAHHLAAALLSAVHNLFSLLLHLLLLFCLLYLPTCCCPCYSNTLFSLTLRHCTEASMTMSLVRHLETMGLHHGTK